jgi:two-component system chemotaxis response regulator CheB
MDMMLPVMSGMAATEYIMAYCPTPILIVSASTNRGELFKTYEALAAGAVDVLEKPRGDETGEDWQLHFIARVKLVAKIRVITHPRARLNNGRVSEPAQAAPGRSERGAEGIEVVAIGASTGGPSAIMDILRLVPPHFSLPILFTIHISEPFGSAFAEWLDGQTAHRVRYARDGESLSDCRRTVVMAPPDRHLEMRDRRLRLTRAPERHSCRPSVDVLFETLAADLGSGVAACLLTGMGRDGAAGLLAVRQAGGRTAAQDESTSVVYGMPREAVNLGAAERVLPIHEIAAWIAALE